ncbi:WAS/WASL-interacting protein family member 3-like [Punica granatum]|nr:WAS/WASL-interacting protein family member 3-like [Punica granatum]
MAELMAMLKDHNRASSSYTLLSEDTPTVDPNPVVPPTFVSESDDVSFSAMTYVPAIHPVSDPLPPPPAPTTVPLPPAAFLLTDSAMHTLSPLAIPAQPPVYTVPLPTVLTVINAQAPTPTMDPFAFQASQPQISFSYLAPPPLNIHRSKPSTPTQAAPTAPLTNFLPEAETKQERGMEKMEETIRALQDGTSRLDYGDFN